MRNNTYNNLGFGIISIASVLNIIKSLSVDKVFLIIPFFTHQELLAFLSNPRTEIKSIEQLVSHKINCFSNYNKRYFDSLVLAINSIQYLIDMLFLCQNGYQVLAYDQLGSGRSEGSVQESLATGIYVAENVLNDVIKRKVNHGLPIFVYGHSWGAYSRAGAIRKYPEVRGAVLRSAPINESKSVLDVRKKEKKGLYYFLLPSYKFCRFFLEGARYIVSSKKGIRKNKTTKILLIYALNDPIVSHNNSLALYFKKHPQSNVETYIQEKGLHNSIITEESYQWFNTENKKIKTELMNNGADKKAREEKILSLAPLSHIVYDEGAERKILSFLDQFAD